MRRWGSTGGGRGSSSRSRSQGRDRGHRETRARDSVGMGDGIDAGGDGGATVAMDGMMGVPRTATAWDCVPRWTAELRLIESDAVMIASMMTGDRDL